MKIPGALLFVLLSLAFGSGAAKAADAEDDIRDLLADQVDAWSRGNLLDFMKPYAEDCTFIGTQIVKGKDKVLARYKSRYPTTAAMGTLTFRKLEVRELSEGIAFVTGEWHLERPAAAGGAVGGIFSLMLKNVDDEWRIVLDHTS